MSRRRLQDADLTHRRTRKREDIYRAAMLEPRCAAELTVDEIRAMVDEMIEAHGSYMQMYD